MILGFLKRTAGFFGNDGHDFLGKLRMTVQPCADRGSTQCDFAQGLLGLFDPLNAELNLPGVAAEFLPKADRCRIL